MAGIHSKGTRSTTPVTSVVDRGPQPHRGLTAPAVGRQPAARVLHSARASLRCAPPVPAARTRSTDLYRLRPPPLPRVTGSQRLTSGGKQPTPAPSAERAPNDWRQ